MEISKRLSEVHFTAKTLKIIGIDPKKLLTFPEALAVNKEINILLNQGVELFLSKPVKSVLDQMKRLHHKEDKLFNQIDAFNYGYIMGIRAERRGKSIK